MVKRNLLHYVRVPQLVVFSSIQPVMFVLLFAYVFGGAITVPTGNYIDYLLPGIIVQTVLFGSISTGIGLAQDLSRGMVDRFRSLPMARSAVLAGRTITDTLRNVFVVLLMTGVGYLIGFRIGGSVLEYAGALGAAVLFGFGFSWISASIGMAVRDVETAQVAGFIWVFPLAFASSIFVPIASMPDWLQVFARNNPISVAVNVVRSLSLGTPVGDAWWHLVIWIIGLVTVFAPLAVWSYGRRTA